MDWLRSRLEFGALCGLLVGCVGPSHQDTSGVSTGDPMGRSLATCDSVDPTQVAIITELWFARIEDGVSWGMDLDDSRFDDCGVEDLTDPEGNTGIDNGLGALIPAIELTEGAAVEVYIQDLINSGEILIMLEMEDVDDPANDGCVNLHVLRGKGEPTVGTDKIIESGQTFDRDLESPHDRVEGATIQDGTLMASPLEFSLPFTIFDIDLTFNLHDTVFRFDQGIDGAHTGFIAGGLFTEEITSFVEGRTDIDIGDLVVNLVEGRADLWPDETGTCKGISVVFEYKAVPAYFFVD